MSVHLFICFKFLKKAFVCMPGNIPKNETYLRYFILDNLRGLNILLVGSGKETSFSSLWFSWRKRTFLLFKFLSYFVVFMSLIFRKNVINFFVGFVFYRTFFMHTHCYQWILDLWKGVTLQSNSHTTRCWTSNDALIRHHMRNSSNRHLFRNVLHW